MAKEPPELVQLNPQQLQQEARAADAQGYLYSDVKYAQEFPWLVRGRNFSANNAVVNLEGGQDPLLTSTLKKSGFGGVDFGDNNYKQGKNLGTGILSKEQRDRGYFQRILSENPQRAFGLNSGDVARIALANSGNQLNFDWANFGSRVNAANARDAEGTAKTQSILQGVGSLAKTIGGLSGGGGSRTGGVSSDPYLNSSYYGGYNPAYQGPQYGQGYASYNLPVTDPNYGQSNYIGLGDTDTSGIAGTTGGGGGTF